MSALQTGNNFWEPQEGKLTYLWEFVSRLSTENRNVFQKIYDEIKYLCRVATAGSKEAKQLEKVKRTFEKAYRETKAEKNTAEGSVRYSLNNYSEHQIENWKNSKRIVVYKNGEQLTQFIQDSINDKRMDKKMYFGTIPSDLAKKIEAETGLNVERYNLSLGSFEIRKILKSHGDEKTEIPRGQRAVTKEDFTHIVDVVLNPKEITLSETDYMGKPVIIFKGNHNGTMNVRAVVSDKRLDLFVQTVFVNIKKENLSTPTDEQASINTPEANNGTVFSYSIPNSSENVKQKDVFGFKIDENADVDEDLLEELSIYHPEAEVDSEGNVTVYHRTSKANAEKIRKTGVMTALEDALFFSSKSEGYASDYGDTVLTFKIPSTVLRVNDIFSGEVHFDVPLKRMNNQWSMNVSKYLVNESVKQNGNLSLSSDNPTPQKYGNYNVYGDDVRYQPDDIAPVREDLQAAKPKAMTEDIAPVREDIKQDLLSRSAESFGITKPGDYVQVQRQVFDTLNSEGFFSDKESRSRTVTNNDSSMQVEINKKGIKETFNYENYGRFSREYKGLKLATVRMLPQIIESGKLISDNINNYHNAESSVKFAYIESVVQVDGKDVSVKVDIKKSPQKNKFWVHSVEIKEKVDGLPANESKSLKRDYIPNNSANSISNSAENVNSDDIAPVREDIITAYLSIEEIAKEYLPMSRKKIRELVTKNLSYRKIGGRIYVARDAIEEWLR